VKVYTEAGAATAPGPPDAGKAAPGGVGREYLRRRRDQRRSREEAYERAHILGRELDSALSGLADDSRRHRPQDPRLSGVPGQNVLNAAYLVSERRRPEFVALVGRFSDGAPATRVELTGPWPPYSFALDGVAHDDPVPAAQLAAGTEPLRP
jgi:hypothetical protein